MDTVLGGGLSVVARFGGAVGTIAAAAITDGSVAASSTTVRFDDCTQAIGDHGGTLS